MITGMPADVVSPLVELIDGDSLQIFVTVAMILIYQLVTWWQV
jgi:hypothetical protein